MFSTSPNQWDAIFGITLADEYYVRGREGMKLILDSRVKSLQELKVDECEGDEAMWDSPWW